MSGARARTRFYHRSTAARGCSGDAQLRAFEHIAVDHQHLGFRHAGHGSNVAHQITRFSGDPPRSACKQEGQDLFEGAVRVLLDKEVAGINQRHLNARQVRLEPAVVLDRHRRLVCAL